MPYFSKKSGTILPLQIAERSTWNFSSTRRSAVWLMLLGAVLLGASRLESQLPGSATSTQADASSQDRSAPAPPVLFGPPSDEEDQAGQTDQSPGVSASGSSFGGAGSAGQGVAGQGISAQQIIQVLQQNPDLVVEVKSQVADRLQQQGIEIDENSISDQMLYEEISTNSDVRTNIGNFLQARGYLSPDSAQALPNGPAERGLANGQALSSADGAGQRNLGALGNAAGPGGAAGVSAADQYAMSSSRALSASGSRAGSQNSPGRPQNDASSSTDVPKVLRKPAPYNLESMRDLYTQIPASVSSLKRFGSEMFLSRTSSAMDRGTANRDIPTDVPLGPDYVLGAGDTLKVDLWGGVTQSLVRTIDRDGSILLPEAGSLHVGGMTLGQAQGLIEGALKRQFRDANVAVTVSHLRAVRVYITGDVQRPGGYDVSSLTTPLGALYAAGGPTAVGSLRFLKHYRGKDLVETVDLYDFLLHGIHSSVSHFESGDTLLVPPAGPQVAVSGAVKRSAIYELGPGESSLSVVVNDAGGLTAAASLSHVTVERIGQDHRRETVTLSLGGDDEQKADHAAPDRLAALEKFQVQDGDRITIAPILPYSERVIYLQGHVVRPGRMPFSDGMKLGDALHGYRDILPEPADHAEIVRLVPPDLHAETIDFSLPDALIGNVNLTLQPFDTIRIFGRYEVDSPKVTISGEVLRPGTYPMSDGMTAAQLVRMAGGFKRDALQDRADLTSYDVVDGNRVNGTLAIVHIGAAVAGTEKSADMRLKPGDILTIHQITGWNDIGESVTIDGQVRFPGSYGFQEGERLSSVLRRAGGLRDTAYPEGAVLIRQQVRELEEKSRDELIRQIEANAAAARLAPTLSGDSGSTLQLIKAQQDETIAELKSHPPAGRLVIHIGGDINSWANTAADVELRRGDVITIPKRPGFVLVTGQVYNATAITFAAGKTAGWYLSHAGGTNGTANRREIFIIRANGSVIGRHSGSWFNADVLSVKLNPGDVIVVPRKIIGTSVFWRNLLTTAQLASSIAITAAVASI